MSTKLQAEYCARLSAAAGKLNQRSLGDRQVRLREFLIRAHDRLSKPPRLLLLGEFNSGKSLLANLLIGESIVPTSIAPNSRFPIRFHYAARSTLGAVVAGRTQQDFAWSKLDQLSRLPLERIDVGLPIERLRKFEVVDTPGINSPLCEGESYERRLPFAHLPIWATAASRAWRESERRAWLRTRKIHWAPSILVVTQTDLLSGPKDVACVLERLAAETSGLFAWILPLCLPQAIDASVIGNAGCHNEAWAISGGARLEQAITIALEEIAARRVASAKRSLLNLFRPGHMLGELARPGTRGVKPAPGAWPAEIEAIFPQLDVTPNALERGEPSAAELSGNDNRTM